MICKKMTKSFYSILAHMFIHLSFIIFIVTYLLTHSFEFFLENLELRLCHSLIFHRNIKTYLKVLIFDRQILWFMLLVTLFYLFTSTFCSSLYIKHTFFHLCSSLTNFLLFFIFLSSFFFFQIVNEFVIFNCFNHI